MSSHIPDSKAAPFTGGSQANEASFDVVAETERLLSGRKRDLKLTGRMLELYRLDSWRQRSKSVRAWMVWVIGVSLAMTLINILLIPEAFWEGALIAGIIVPALSVGVHRIWRKPRSAIVEGLSIVVWMCALVLAFSAIGLDAGGHNAERYATGALFVCAVGTLVLGIDITATKLAAALTMFLALSFHLLNPALPMAAAIAITLFYGIGILATVVARHNATIIAHHSFLITLRDAHRRAELAEANIRLAELATTDALTGIANRRSAGDTIARLWSDEDTRSAGIAFVMADIDHFKRLNDTRGHAAGDACIREVARTIADVIRPELDFTSRHGGEEFLVVLTKVTTEEAGVIAERIRQAVESLQISNPGAEAGVVTLSIGVAFASRDAGPELVTKWADDALYAAKDLGRNRICFSAEGAPERRRPAEAGGPAGAKAIQPALRAVARAS